MDVTTGGDPLLVVVADDGGVDVARNRGIVDACAAGVIGAVSILATGAALRDLRDRIVDLPRDLRPDIGLHLNLTEGCALTGVLPGVTDASGAFCGDKQAFWDRALGSRLPENEIEREVRAQIAALRDAGLPPTRIDGHQHVHVLPGVRGAIVRALASHRDIRWTRLGRPVCAPGAVAAGFPRLDLERIATPWRALQAAGRVAQAALGTLHDECDELRSAGLRSTDVFTGPDLMATPALDSCVAEIRAAVALARERGLRSIELMTHPGDCDEDSVAFSADPSRRAEARILCGADLAERLAHLGVRLVRFTDIEAGA